MAGGINGYVYVHSRPLVASDALGLESSSHNQSRIYVPAPPPPPGSIQINFDPPTCRCRTENYQLVHDELGNPYFQGHVAPLFSRRGYARIVPTPPFVEYVPTECRCVNPGERDDAKICKAPPYRDLSLRTWASARGQ
jgi:hypothetical protein